MDVPYPRAPCLQIIPTLGPKVYKYDLHWAIWSPRDRVLKGFRSCLEGLASGTLGFGTFGSRITSSAP